MSRRPAAVRLAVALVLSTFRQFGANQVAPLIVVSRTIVHVPVPSISKPADALSPTERTTVLLAGATAGVAPSQATERAPEAIWSAIAAGFLTVPGRYVQDRVNHPHSCRRIPLSLTRCEAGRCGV